MKYYAMIDGQQKGPFELEELPAAGVRPSTYIWCKGMKDWEKAEDNADVCRLFRNHLYDIMHPTQAHDRSDNNDPYKIQPDTESPKTFPSKFDIYLKDTGESLPTLEEIDSQTDTSTQPTSMIGAAWLVTILCFPPTGIAALVFAYRSKTEWKNGNNSLSHDYCRSAKMWVGISFFLGLILYAFLFIIF